MSGMETWKAKARARLPQTLPAPMSGDPTREAAARTFMLTTKWSSHSVANETAHTDVRMRAYRCTCSPAK
eukprot:6413411-Prymnesium_polylepis.1